jgi:hypothetical protein
MSVITAIQETWGRVTGRSEIQKLYSQDRETLAHIAEMTESMGLLEHQMLEPGWQRLTADADHEFTRDGLRRITAVCRIMALKNPLIKRGLSLRQSYIWGQGVEITARDKKINDVVQLFLDDNISTFSGAQARTELDHAVHTDGNVFLALFTQPLAGRVRVRAIPWDEITNVVTNPEDKSEPWYYRREWWWESIDPTSGGILTARKSCYYPALGYQPRVRPVRMNLTIYGDSGDVPVQWDAPIYHVKVNTHLHWKWGVPDVYAAIDWAMAYKDFLTDWATLVKSLSRFAWRLTAPGSKQAQARAKLSAAPGIDPVTGEFRSSGATALQPPGQMLEAIPKSGATIDSESGRPLAAMVAAALDLPVTMLLGDPGVTGARATAETLDTPTERAMDARRGIWSEAYNAILQYVIVESVRAPEGILHGKIVRDEYDSEQIKLWGKRDTTIDISWPDLDEVDVEKIVKSIVEADGTGHIPPLVIARLLLEALGVSDIDQILEKLTGPDGEFLAPTIDAGQAAAAAFRQGQDPAALINGPPGAPAPEVPT